MLSVLFIIFFRLSADFIAFTTPLILAFLFPAIMNGKAIIYNISINGKPPSLAQLFSFQEISVTSFINNFGHPYVSMYRAFDLIDLAGLRFFYDFPQGVLFFSRVFGFDAGLSLTYLNTFLHYGVFESIVPTGYLSFGFAQAGMMGVFLMGVFYRLVFKLITLIPIFGFGAHEAAKFFAALVSANTFYTGEFRTLVLVFYLPLFVYYFLGKLLRGSA